MHPFMEAILNKLTETGIVIDIFNDEITAKYDGVLKGISVLKTMPHNSWILTDTQPQLMHCLLHINRN